MNNQIKVEQFWVYRLKDGTYYKRHSLGSWASRNVVRNDISTPYPMLAERFPELPLDAAEPYLHQALRGGKWVKMKLISTVKLTSTVKVV